MKMRRRLRLIAAESVTRSTAVHIVQESVWTGGQDSAKVAETLTSNFFRVPFRLGTDGGGAQRCSPCPDQQRTVPG